MQDAKLDRRAEIRKKLDALKSNIHESDARASQALANMDTIIKESERVIGVAHNSKNILDNLDAEFERRTSLNKIDMSFLLLAVALQCARQYIFANDKFRLTSQEGDTIAERIIPKKWHDVLLASVPYDAIKKNDPNENTGLGGYTHRYRTLGHDPVLGWVFGPMNILSDSLTKTDIVTSYSVKSMRICERISTSDVFSNGIEQIQSDKYLLPTAVMRQAIHFGTDYFTKQGLPVPFISSVDNDISKNLITQCNIDIYSITRGIALSVLINAFISCIHQLFYDKRLHNNHKLYEVKTRKILSYSNLIASTSNIIYVAISCYLGDKKSLKKLDIGGIIVTLHRIISDIHFIGEIKREFIMESFNEMIRSDEYDF